MELEILAILLLAAGLSTILWIITHEIRQIFGYRRLVLLSGHLLLLLPWLAHLNEFLSMSNLDVIPWQIYFMPLLLLSLVFLIVQVESQVMRITNALVPFLAFVVTRYYIMPIVYEITHDYKFDNIPTIWLFFWSILATSTILAYVLPAQPITLQKYKD